MVRCIANVNVLLAPHLAHRHACRGLLVGSCYASEGHPGRQSADLKDAWEARPRTPKMQRWLVPGPPAAVCNGPALTGSSDDCWRAQQSKQQTQQPDTQKRLKAELRGFGSQQGRAGQSNNCSPICMPPQSPRGTMVALCTGWAPSVSRATNACPPSW